MNFSADDYATISKATRELAERRNAITRQECWKRRGWPFEQCWCYKAAEGGLWHLPCPPDPALGVALGME